jgi:hypothetical protein
MLTTISGLRQSCEVYPSQPWPLQILLSIGISFPDLLQAFESVFEGETRAIMGSPDPLSQFLSLKSVVEVLEEWLTVAMNGVKQNRAYRELNASIGIGSRLLNRIDEYKASLEELSSFCGVDKVRRLVDRLVRVEESIRRI